MFKVMREYNHGGPYAATEVWGGMFDNWGVRHRGCSVKAVLYTLEKILSLNGSINFYMYVGSTNFGYTNGVSTNGQQIVTSYDYDAQLSEAGDMTWKYQQTLEMIKKYRPTRTMDVKNSTKKNYGKLVFKQGLGITKAIETLTYNSTDYDTPIVMEELNVGYGFVVYRKRTNGGGLKCPEIIDRANILVDGRRFSIQEKGGEAEVQIPSGILEILVENHGRRHVRPDTVKGLTKTPTLDGVEIKGWTNIGLDTESNLVQKLPWESELPENVPGFYRATFIVDEIGDTFLNPKGWTRGIAWINGYNIGRYWTIGPQLTLYVPGGLLKLGENEVIVFEVEHLGKINGSMTLDDVPQLSIIP
jgi:beta-galactosidase